MPSKYESSPYKAVNLDAKQAINGRKENVNDKHGHKKKKFKDKALRGFENY